MEASCLSLTSLDEEERMFQENVRQFAVEQITPKIKEMDRNAVMDPGLISQLFKLGLMGIDIPSEYDGSGGSFFMSILAVEELSAVDASIGVLVDVQNTLVNNAVSRWGTDALRQQYLPRLATDTVGAYALSESSSGSDAFALTTRAERKGDHYVLNGKKLWITSAKEARVFLIFATVDPAAGYKGITAFVVENDFPGFLVGPREDKLGIRASSTCEIILENCPVPAENVVGEVGKGYKVSIETLNEGRIGIGAQMIGIARSALETTIKYCKERQQFGKPISDFQGVQFQLAEMAIELAAARLMVYNAARLRGEGQPFAKEAAMAKYHSSVATEHITSMAIELHGGYGYSKEYPVEKYYRDAKIGKIYEGTSNMQLQTIAKLILAD